MASISSRDKRAAKRESAKRRQELREQLTDQEQLERIITRSGNENSREANRLRDRIA